MQKDTVTVRDRDTMQQIRLPIDQLVPYIEKKIEFSEFERLTAANHA